MRQRSNLAATANAVLSSGNLPCGRWTSTHDPEHHAATSLTEWRASWDEGRRELARRMSSIEACLEQISGPSPRFPHLRIFPASAMTA